MSTPRLPPAAKALLLDIAGQRRALRWAKGWKPDWPGSKIYRHSSGQALVTRGFADTRYGPGPVKLHLNRKGEDLAREILNARMQRQSA